MAETVFTCEEVEKLPLQKRSTSFAVFFAPLASFAKYFFVGDAPGHGRDGNREDK